MPKLYRTRRIAAVSCFALCLAFPAPGQDIPPEVQARLDAMQARIDAQQQELEVLKAEIAAQYNSEAQKPRLAAAPVPTPAPVPPVAASVTMKNGSASIASTDGAFSVAFKGIFQVDAATYSQDKGLPGGVPGRDLSSGTNIRRARLGLTGKMFRDFDYMLLTDFGGSGAEDVGRIHEAWLQYSGFKSVKLRIGEFAPNVGLADAGSAGASPFLERAAVAEMARNLVAGDTRMGMAAFNAHDRWLWFVALTGNTVSTLNTQSSDFVGTNSDEQLGLALRLAGTPFRGDDWLIHAGINRSAIINPADAGASATIRFPVQLRERPELRVDGTRLIDTGAIDAESATATGIELGWRNGPLFLQSEAFRFDIDRRDPMAGLSDPEFTGWYVEGGWVLTGESRRYNTVTAAFDGVTPLANFDPSKGRWGAWELVARYSTLDLDYQGNVAVAADRILGGQQDIASLGLNWQLNPAMRFVFQGQNVKVVRVNSSGVPIGQKYSSYAIRSQFNF